MPVCDPRLSYECVALAMAIYLRDNEAASCNCRRRCRRLTYQTTVSQAQLSMSAAAFVQQLSNVNSTLYQITSDHCVVEVGLQALMCNCIEELITMKLSGVQKCANFGPPCMCTQIRHSVCLITFKNCCVAKAWYM